MQDNLLGIAILGKQLISCFHGTLEKMDAIFLQECAVNQMITELMVW